MSINRKSQKLALELQQLGIQNPAVLEAIKAVPRSAFLPPALQHKAYENTALPIGQGQTISQPYMVARMTELLLDKVGADGKVLEIGTGSGYQTAILASLFRHVFSVERIKSLQFQAKRRLNQLDLHNINMKHGDGWQGWSSKGPFDAIIVTAAAESLPNELLQQLSPISRVVIPIGKLEQKLICIDKYNDDLSYRDIESVKFVPLVAGELL